jgi:putative SOS response-associated peptidase YedK
MCGRFVSATPPDELARYFGAEPVAEAHLEPSWNVAPTKDVYVIVETGGVRQVDAFHWGLVPFWAKSPAAGNKMINARAETLADKGAYRRAFAKRRCIIPADGFYEWEKPGPDAPAPSKGKKAKKQPWYIHRPDGEPLAFAGMWEVWRGPDGDGSDHLRSTTIITGAPNKKMAAIHDRMPVILPPDAWSTWLDRDQHDLDLLGKLLVPAPPQILTLHPVSTDVGNVANDSPHLVDGV